MFFKFTDADQEAWQLNLDQIAYVRFPVPDAGVDRRYAWVQFVGVTEVQEFSMTPEQATEFEQVLSEHGIASRP